MSDEAEELATPQEIVELIEEACDKLESVLARSRVAFDAVAVDTPEHLIRVHEALKMDLAKDETVNLLNVVTAGWARYMALSAARLKKHPLPEGIDDAVAMADTFAPAMAKIARVNDAMRQVTAAADSAAVRDVLRRLST